MNNINGLSIQNLLIASLLLLSLNISADSQQQNSEILSDSEEQPTQQQLSAGESIEVDTGDTPEPTEIVTQSAEDKAALEAAQVAAQAMALPVEAYQRCVKAVIGSSSPTGGKHEEIDTKCQDHRQLIVESLPKDLQEFMLLNMERRVDMVLEVMEDAEEVIEYTAEDIEEAVDELAAQEDEPITE